MFSRVTISLKSFLLAQEQNNVHNSDIWKFFHLVRLSISSSNKFPITLSSSQNNISTTVEIKSTQECDVSCPSWLGLSIVTKGQWEGHALFNFPREITNILLSCLQSIVVQRVELCWQVEFKVSRTAPPTATDTKVSP